MTMRRRRRRRRRRRNFPYVWKHRSSAPSGPLPKKQISLQVSKRRRIFDSFPFFPKIRHFSAYFGESFDKKLYIELEQETAICIGMFPSLRNFYAKFQAYNQKIELKILALKCPNFVSLGQFFGIFCKKTQFELLIRILLECFRTTFKRIARDFIYQGHENCFNFAIFGHFLRVQG